MSIGKKSVRRLLVVGVLVAVIAWLVSAPSTTTNIAEYTRVEQPIDSAVHKTPIAKMVRMNFGYCFPTNGIAGVIKSAYGDDHPYGTGGVGGVKLSIEWHLSSGRVETHTVTTVPDGGTPPPGVGYVPAGMFSDSCGYFWETVDHVVITIISVPDGYQDCLGVIYWYR